MIELLLKKDLYLKQFGRLSSKAKSKPWLKDKYYITESINLGWVLRNRDFIVKELVKTIKTRKYQTPIAIEREVQTDNKLRLLYHFDWPEKILQGVIADALLSIYEPYFSDSLNSYRKGRGANTTLLKLSRFFKKINDGDEIYIFKRDISAYGDSIRHDLLFDLLAKKIDSSSYFFEIIKKTIDFKYHAYDTGELKTKEIGLPTGSQVNNVINNIFLHELDHQLDNLEESCYFRFGDDICAVASNRVSAVKIDYILNKYISERELVFKKEKDIAINIFKSSQAKESFKYLGLMIDINGQISLSPEKEKKFKVKMTKLIKKVRLMLKSLKLSKEEEVEGIIKSLRYLIFNTDFYTQTCSYFQVVHNDQYWKKIDLWVAETLLEAVYRKRSGKNFARYPFSKLRKKGLPSFNHMRKLYLDGKGRLDKYKTSFGDNM